MEREGKFDESVLKMLFENGVIIACYCFCRCLVVNV